MPTIGTKLIFFVYPFLLFSVNIQQWRADIRPIFIPWPLGLLQWNVAAKSPVHPRHIRNFQGSCLVQQTGYLN